LEVSVKENWGSDWNSKEWKVIKNNSRKPQFKYDTAGRFCLQSNADGYARLFVVDENQTPTQIALNQFQKDMQAKYVDTKYDAIKLEKNRQLCMGEDGNQAFVINEELSPAGQYRLWAHAAVKPEDLFVASDVVTFGKLLPARLAVGVADKELERNLHKIGSTTFYYQIEK